MATLYADNALAASLFALLNGRICTGSHANLTCIGESSREPERWCEGCRVNAAAAILKHFAGEPDPPVVKGGR